MRNYQPNKIGNGFGGSGPNFELIILINIVKIQSLLRGWLARRKFTKLKIDAYNTKVD